MGAAADADKRHCRHWGTWRPRHDYDLFLVCISRCCFEGPWKERISQLMLDRTLLATATSSEQLVVNWKPFTAGSCRTCRSVVLST